MPLEKLIGESVKLQKKGGQYSGCCPFHSEKTPSFYIYTDNYHCFGCGAHGDAITFIRETQGLGFIEALKTLAKKYGIDATELERNDQRTGAWREESKLANIMTQSQQFFINNLYSDSGKVCLDYLRSRGFTDDFIREHGFGFAPDDPASLYRHLSSLGHKAADIEKCSLATRYDNGKIYDFFKNRALVPIRDTSGRLIAFGGRALDDAPNKYKNSKYDKGSVLYGLFTARTSIRKKHRAIVCEGYMDALQMWNFGFTETVACQGTALTANHMRLLKLVTKTVYLMFDGDKAGKKASLKALSESLNTPEVDFRVVSLPLGQDPDSFVKQHGKEGIEGLIDKSTPLLDFALTEKITNVHASALPELLNQELLPWVSKTTDPLRQDLLINKISDLTGFSKSRLNSRLRILMNQTKSQPSVRQIHPSEMVVSKLHDIEQELFGHLYFAEPTDIDIDKIVKFVNTELQLEHPWEEAFESLVQCHRQGTSPHKADVSIYPGLFQADVAKLIVELRSSYRAYEVEDRSQAISLIFLHRRRKNLQKAISDLKAELATSSAQANDSWKSIASAIGSLQSQLRSIDNT